MHPMPKISKRFSAVAGKVEDRTYAPLDAVELVKANATAKFDETLEAHARLGIDPKYTDQQLRTTVALPHGTGQSVRIAVIARGEKVAEAKAAGADLAGDDDLVDTIAKGEMEFDLLIATPDMMPVVGRLGKILGPRGLMPNPKIGTVTMDVGAAVPCTRSGEAFGEELIEVLSTQEPYLEQRYPAGVGRVLRHDRVSCGIENLGTIETVIA